MKQSIILTGIVFVIIATLSTCKKVEPDLPPTTAIIAGKITDARSNLAIAGANVRLDKGNSTTTSSSDGSYNFADLVPDSYTITVTKSGFIIGSQNITVVAGDKRTIDFQMEVPSVSILPETYSAQATAGITNVMATTNTTWTAVSTEPAWLTCTPSGSGSGTIAVNYLVNNSTTTRTATIAVTVTGLLPRVFTFTQAGQTPNIGVYPTLQNVLSTAGSSVFSVTANTNWTASSDQPWCTVSPANGTGNATFSANYTGNSLNASRTATITISSQGAASQTVTLTQAQFVASLSVSPQNQSISSVAGSTSFNVASNITWSATSDQTWCTVVSGSGNGSGTISLNYAANTTAGNRIANILVSGNGVANQVVTVSQANIVGTLTIAPLNQNVNPSTGNTTFTITTNGAWSAASDQTWCTLTNASGNGNGTITANFTANSTLGNRIANITVTGTGVANQTVTVTQTYTVPALSVAPANQSALASAGNTSFTVTSNITWTATSDQTWCTFTNTSGNGNGTLTVNYAANATSSQRVANITLSGSGVTSQSVSVTQAGTIPTSGLVAYYPFNGNANDESGNGNNGTVNGATLTSDRKGNVNKAYSFDGVNDNIDCGLNNQLGMNSSTQLSIAVWIKPTVFETYNISNGTIVSKYYYGNSSNSNYYCGVQKGSDNSNKMNVSGNGTNLLTGDASINNWQFFVFIFNQGISNTKIYRNGVLIISGSLNYNSNFSTSPFFIGYMPKPANEGSNTNFTGLIDDIRIYNRALTDSEIQALYNE